MWRRDIAGSAVLVGWLRCGVRCLDYYPRSVPSHEILLRSRLGLLHVRLTECGLEFLTLGLQLGLARRPAPSARRSRPPSKNAFFQLCTDCSDTPARRPSATTDNSPRSTLNTTRSFSSGLFFEAFAMLISLRQTQTAN